MKKLIFAMIGVAALSGCAKDYQVNNTQVRMKLQPLEYAAYVNNHFRTNLAFMHEGTSPIVEESEITTSKRFIIEPLAAQFDNVQLSFKDYCEKRDMEWVVIDNIQPSGGFYSCQSSSHPYTSKSIDFVYHLIPMLEDETDWKENVETTPRYYFTIYQSKPNWPAKRFFDHSLNKYYELMREEWRDEINSLRPEKKG